MSVNWSIQKITAVAVFVLILHMSAGGPLLFVRIGEDAHFSWPLDPKPEKNEPVTISNQNGDNLFYFTKDDLRTKFNERVQVIKADNDWNVEFTLKSTVPHDAGLYSSSYTARKYPAQELILLDKPELPNIHEASKPVVGNNLVLKCSTKSRSIARNHKLNMSFHWMMDGVNASENKRFNVSASIFTIPSLQLNDSGSKIVCKTHEQHGLVSDSSKPYIVDAEYGPHDIAFNPERKTYRIPEGVILPSITCTAKCNPLCTYKWLKESQVKIIGNSFVLTNVKRVDSGKYYCKVKNYIKEVLSHSIEIIVSDIPGKPFLKEIHPSVENADLKLGCFENSSQNEQTFYELVTFQWTTKSQISEHSKRYKQNGPFLMIKALKRDDNGTLITCNVTGKSGDTSVNSKPYLLNILYGPKEVQISSTKYSFKMAKGTYIPNILCWSDCSPKCNFKWYKDRYTKEITTGNVLVLGKITEEKAGDYFCQASNMYGSNYSKRIKVDVAVIMINESAICINNQSVSLDCHVESNTEDFKFLPWIHKKGNKDLRIFTGKTEENMNTLLIHQCNVFDSGIYECRVRIEEKPETNITAGTYLNVYGPPVFISDKIRIIIEPLNASISIRFHSIPDYQSVVWYRNHSVIYNGHKFRFFTITAEIKQELHDDFINLQGFQTSLYISNLSDEDYGTYSVFVNNSFGETEQEIHLNPIEVNRITKYWISITVSTILTTTGVVSLSIGLFCCYRRMKERKRIKVALDKIRMRQTHRSAIPSIVGSEELCMEENEHYTYDSIVNESLNEENNSRSGGTNSLSRSSYDYAIEVAQNNSSELSQHSSYEDLKIVTNPVPYEDLDDDKKKKDSHDTRLAVTSDVESNMADDENSTSNSSDEG